MKVLLVGKYYHPYFGGIETFSRTLAEGLVRVGDQVDVLCFSEKPRASPSELEGVRIFAMPASVRLSSQPLSARYMRTLRQIAGDYDVIHVQSLNPLGEMALLGLGPQLRNSALVSSFHHDLVGSRVLAPFYRPFLRRFLNRCDAIGISTEAFLDRSPSLQAHRAKCCVIPMGLSDKNLTLNESVRREVESLRAQHGPFSLFVGRLVPYKGLEHLIAALSDAPEQRLVLVGEGPLRGELEAQAIRLGVHARVHFVGRVDDPNCFAAYLHACQLFVLPSVSASETFGLSLVEAMACGKALVTTRLRTGTSFVNPHGVTGLEVAPGDSQALAAALERLRTQPELSSTMGAAGRQRYERIFSAESMVRSYRALYASILSSGSLTRAA